MKLVPFLVCLITAFGSANGQEPPPLLDREDVWLLVMNIPEVMDVESRKGCPDIEFSPVGKDRMWDGEDVRRPALWPAALSGYRVYFPFRF